METQTRTWYLYWTDDDWPADGLIEVEADSEAGAIAAGTQLMKEKAARGEGPENWNFVYAPTDRKPNWLKLLSQ